VDQRVRIRTIERRIKEARSAVLFALTGGHALIGLPEVVEIEVQSVLR
jgi:hypothetical protein